MTQLGFDSLLDEGAANNEMHQLKAKYPGLPATWDEAIPHYRRLLERCHAAFLAADRDEIARIYDEAEAIAYLMNGDTAGILSPDGAGTRLAAATRSQPGAVPLWGQEGEFIVEAAGCRVRIEADGIFGIATRIVLMPGFAAHAVDGTKPFISETGFRSFIGIQADIVPGMAQDEFAIALIEHHVARANKGKLVKIDKERYFRGEPSETVDP
jgi:hypothetical protein